MIPFTREQFLEVFESYNESIYPFQWILFVLALAAVVLSLKREVHSNRIVAGLLFALWCWTGVVYHWVFFSRINKAAFLFGLLCIIQAVFFLRVGVFRSQMDFRPQLNVFGVVGSLLILYALAIYPVLSYSFEHTYPQSPTFGVPCPTTIFTFGLLLWLGQKVPRFLVAIPLAWSLVGMTAVFSFGILEDMGLVVAGVLGSFLAIYKPLHLRLPPKAA